MLRHVLLSGDELDALLDAASDDYDIEPTAPTTSRCSISPAAPREVPKGAVHVHGAVVAHHATGLYCADLHPDDVFWCTADPGWVTGTSYGIIARSRTASRRSSTRTTSTPNVGIERCRTST